MGADTFSIDPTTPRNGVRLDDTRTTATRDATSGWVTLRSERPLTPARHTFAIRISDHGQSADGSGLMVGLLPRLPPTTTALLGSKYISELGGWCLSHAGDSYGAWKCDRIAFAAGAVVEFDIDLVAKTVHVTCGRDSAAGHLSSLAEGEELYPAVSLYYAGQEVSFL